MKLTVISKFELVPITDEERAKYDIGRMANFKIVDGNGLTYAWVTDAAQAKQMIREDFEEGFMGGVPVTIAEEL